MHLARRTELARRGFTLVELLVVVGIIALLIAILLPALAKARRSANAANCLSNLHQIGLAAMMHANEHNGCVPLAGAAFPTNLNDLTLYACYYASGQRTAPWQAALSQYMGSRMVIDTYADVGAELVDIGYMKPFTCPSQATPIPLSDDLETTYGYAPQAMCSYGFNEQITGVKQLPGATAAELRRAEGKVYNTARAAETVLYFDGLPRTLYGQFINVYQYYGDATAGTPPFDQQYVGTLAEPYLDTANAFRATVFDKQRHDGRMNVAFVDGHAAGIAISAADMQHVIVDNTLWK